MKKIALLIALAMLMAVVGVHAADKTITPTPGKAANVGGLPVFITFQSSNVGTADNVVVDGPAGFMPDYVFVSVPHTTSSLQIGCEWYRGMSATSNGITIANNGTRGFTNVGTITLDSVTGNFTFGAACHSDDAPIAGWAARYAQ